jgi:hypothetical protein
MWRNRRMALIILTVSSGRGMPKPKPAANAPVACKCSAVRAWHDVPTQSFFVYSFAFPKFTFGIDRPRQAPSVGGRFRF